MKDNYTKYKFLIERNISNSDYVFVPKANVAAFSSQLNLFKISVDQYDALIDDFKKIEAFIKEEYNKTYTLTFRILNDIEFSKPMIQLVVSDGLWVVLEIINIDGKIINKLINAEFKGNCSILYNYMRVFNDLDDSTKLRLLLKKE